MLDSLLDWDISLFLFLNNLGSPTYDSLWIFLTKKEVNISLYLVLAFWYYRIKGLRETFVLIISVALLILITDQTANIFKYGFERLRPCHNPEIKDLVRITERGCGGLYSYFSAHASNSFALSTYFSILLSKRIPKIKLYLFLFASLVAYSRIYIGVHYPLDIISGLIFGVLAALGVYCLTTTVRRKLKF